MRGLPVSAAVLLTALSLAGCLEGDPDVAPDPTGDASPPAAPTHVLVGAVEPSDLVAPAFKLLGAIAQGGPAYGAGEPSLWAHLDGTLYASFPGCDTGPYLVDVPGSAPCLHGLVYKSGDAGATWDRLNRDSDGRLTSEGPEANGDADVAVDAAGTVYASNLGAGIQVLRSSDGGVSWTHVADVVPPDGWADRQWMAAAGPGHLIMTWMGGAQGADRQVAVNTTFDGGGNWTGVQYLGQDIGWLGTVQFAPDGVAAYVPFTQPTGTAGPVLGLGAARDFQLLLARTLDGGRTWDVLDTGVLIPTSATGLHWSGVLMAPAFDVIGDGTLVYAWSEETVDPTDQTSLGAVVKYTASPDGGATWTTPRALSMRAAAIMPWVTGGAGDRFAVTYYASDVPLDTDYAGAWDVEAVVVDGAAADTPRVARSVLERLVHVGGLCARGGLCLLSGSDRALLDFFEADLLPDGRLAVVYPADPPQGAKYIEIRFALQDGGTPLLLRPAQE